jgi:hypothetical protein
MSDSFVTTAEDLAPIYEGELDGALFEDYLADLEELADVERVLVKDGPESHADGAPLDLDQARMLLLTGAVRGVQIRYRHQRVAWIDTLVRTGASIRLLRVEAPRPGEAPACDAASDGKRRLRVLA